MTRLAHRFYNTNALKLGLFAANCSGGMAITNVAERWSATWDANLALAKMADAAGLEFMLPVARWTGYQEDSFFHRDVLETMSWASALLQATDQITVFATVHTGFNHPIIAAKQCATADHIGHGRFGLNIVCGWNRYEYEMFGIELPKEHAARYALGQEWYDIVRKLWTQTAPFDWRGEHYTLNHVAGGPKPYFGDCPPVLSAASSAEGRAFAIKNADYLFTVLADIDKGSEDVSAVKSQAAAEGRTVGVFTTTYVVCRPTDQEAHDYHRHYADTHANWREAERFMELQNINSKSFPPEVFEQFKGRFAGGNGVYPVIGSPDTVADTLEAISKAGFDGTTLAFVDYTGEFPYFRDEVMPRLERRGLRAPHRLNEKAA
jgi:alkanesulfonate monooxygenase SsuD/methylene tetrahydromethanopterin reductase-like flavin-dependent oxidoreductase (luciferase family)